ncbi:MAG: D-alanyl-D-alanine carboxypeptidase family protein [Bacillota bacterium]
MKRMVFKKLIHLCLATTLIFSGNFFGIVSPLSVQAFPVATSANVNLTSQAAIVLDYDTGTVLYENNADTLMVPASLTKMMQAYIVYEEIEAGNLNFDSMIQVSPLAASMSRNEAYPQAVPLTSGSYLSIDTLLKLILVPSASASCIVLAEHISGSEAAFVERMNETATRMGMEANYENCHGASVHYVTARSQAILVRNFIADYPDILRYTNLHSISFGGKSYVNTNRFVGISPYPNVDGFKSGNITAAGFCLAATINRDGHRLISVTFKASSRESLYTDNIAILENSYKLLKTNSPVYEGIGTHALRSEIEQFYNSGFSPYPIGTTVLPDSAMWSHEFYSILQSICTAYGLDFENNSITGQNLTKETAAKLIYDTLPFVQSNEIPFADRSSINENYRTAVDSVVSSGVLYNTSLEYFNPTETFTKAAAAATINQLLTYVQNNIGWLPKNGDASTSVVLQTPLTIDIPFIFNTYNSAFANDAPILTYTPRTVKLLEVQGGNWWKVDIDGSIQWLYTQGNMTYCTAYTPVFASPNDTSQIIGTLDPQVMDVFGHTNGYMKIYTKTGEGWIKENQLNESFTITEGFSLIHKTGDNLFYTTTHPAQTVTIMDIGENGLWYVTFGDNEGWYNSQNAYHYTDSGMQAINVSVLDQMPTIVEDSDSVDSDIVDSDEIYIGQITPQ